MHGLTTINAMNAQAAKPAPTLPPPPYPRSLAVEIGHMVSLDVTIGWRGSNAPSLAVCLDGRVSQVTEFRATRETAANLRLIADEVEAFWKLHDMAISPADVAHV